MSWLAVYVGLCPRLSIALAFASLLDPLFELIPLAVTPSASGLWLLFLVFPIRRVEVVPMLVA